MSKKSLIPIFLLSFLAGWSQSQIIPDNAKLLKTVAARGQAEVVITVSGVDDIRRLSRDYSIRSTGEKEVSLLLSPLTVERFISEGKSYLLKEEPVIKGEMTAVSLAEAMVWDTYPTFTQYDSIMHSFASLYPSLCMLDTIGMSINGKPVLVLKISDNCLNDESEPEVFYSSSIHGDETGGFILMLRLSDYLLRNYTTDSRVKNLVDNLEIWINPLANPDGTYRNGDVISSPVRFNAAGYDLNRNFPDPEGPQVTRQKETIDMIRFMSERRFVLSANFHSGEEVVNYPWDRWPYEHADDDWFYTVSREWADTVHLHAPQGYMDYLDNGVTRGWEWYSILGGRQDYVTYSLHGRELTVELDEDYITPVSELDDLWEYNYRSMLGYLENALFGIRGLITGFYDGKPVPAVIVIEDHDRDSSHVVSDTASGVFTRLISPGIYDLKISAGGFRDTIIQNVNVIPGERTDINIVLVPLVKPPDTTKRLKPFLYPNPGRGEVNVILPEGLTGSLNVKIYGITGELFSDFDIEAPEGESIKLDLSRLGPGEYIIVFKSKTKRLSGTGRYVITML
jgi:hypothetical protein